MVGPEWWIPALRAISDLNAYDVSMVPQVTFTDPEVPRVGLTDAEPAEKTDGARIAFLPMNAIDYR